MPQILTFVSPQKKDRFYEKIEKQLAENAIEPNNTLCLAEDEAYDVFIGDKPVSKARMDSMRDILRSDIFIQDDKGAEHRLKSIFLADMDATMVQEETLDELADYAGLKKEIAEITARTMRGELDFESSVRARVAKLKGLSTAFLEEARSKITFTRGGDVLIRTLKEKNVRCVLVSGGFTYFTSHVAETLGFDAHFGNRLEIEGGAVTGVVLDPILGKAFKKQLLQDQAKEHGCDLSQSLCVGDGANDADMLTAAQDAGGGGIGFYPKPLLKDALQNYILYGDLTALLYFQGIPKSAFSF